MKEIDVHEISKLLMMNKDYQYSFTTVWKIKASINDVWELLFHSENWPRWWKGLLQATTIKQGDENDIGKEVNYVWKSALPYRLSFNVVSSKIEKPFIMEGNAIGELEGTGKWVLEEINGITTVTYYWNVSTTKKWMNSIGWLLKPIFVWNHNVVMKWGGEGLAKQLNTTLL